MGRSRLMISMKRDGGHLFRAWWVDINQRGEAGLKRILGFVTASAGFHRWTRRDIIAAYLPHGVRANRSRK